MAFQESSMGQYEIIVFKEFQGENQSLPCAFPIAFPAIICQQVNAFHYISGTVIQFISGLYSPRFRGQCLFLFGQCTSKVHHGANMSQQCNSQAGKDVKENLKNWAKQQEAELAEEPAGYRSEYHGVPKGIPGRWSGCLFFLGKIVENYGGGLIILTHTCRCDFVSSLFLCFPISPDQ